MSIPGSASPLFFQTAAAAETAANIIKSVRFNSADSAHLNRTPSSAGNRKTWTWAGWVKRGEINTSWVPLFEAFDGSSYSNTDYLQLVFYLDQIGLATNSVWFRRTTAVYRDYSAWMHLVCAFDTTQSTGADRVKIYVNGTQITTFVASSDPTVNTDYGVNRNVEHEIGRRQTTNYFDGYLADIYFIDGQALDPTSFGAFDANGVWQAAAYSGTYGTNGFHLFDFANESGIGNDSSGNDNDWTVNNINGSSFPSGYTADYAISGTASTYTGYGTAYGWQAAFDGNLATGPITYITGYSELDVQNKPSWSSKIRIFIAAYYAGDVTINGTALGINSSGWKDVTSLLGSSGTLNTVRISSVGSNYVRLAGIELDNTILNDGGSTFFSSEIDLLLDSPTNGTQTDTGAGGEVSGNYCTLNPLINAGLTLSNGNLDFTSSTSNRDTCVATHGVSSGKWYWEYTVSGSDYSTAIGIEPAGFYPAADDRTGLDSSGYAWWIDRREKWHDGSSGTYGASVSSNAVIGVALDLDGGSLTFYLNGSTQGAAYTGISGTYLPSICDCANAGTGGSSGIGAGSMNFGQRPFAYTAPSGYKALCTTNLPTPTIADGSDYFDVVEYSGSGWPDTTNPSQSITGLSFSPDFVWAKAKNTTYPHGLFDIVRGVNRQLRTNGTNAESVGSGTTASLVSFDSDGFSLGPDGGAGSINYGNGEYVAWTWDAGSSNATNTDGSITSTVRANANAGFSIVTYTGNGSGTVGHGLNATPSTIWVFDRGGMTYQGSVYHSSFNNNPEQNVLIFASSAVGTNNLYPWNNTLPTSSVFSVNSWNCTASNNYVAYCFAPVDGYSSFGSYTGNGSADGLFIYTGFRPALVIVKRISTTGYWPMFDSSRDTYNVVDAILYSSTSGAESTGEFADFLSNGFKIRSADNNWNASASNYIYMAWAENPFSSNGGLAR